MDINHCNELITLSQEIYDQATEKLTNFLSAKYCAVGNNTMEQQMEDYLFVTEETSAYFLGNALALLEPDSREEAIETFVSNLRQVIRHQINSADRNTPPG